MGEIGKRNLPIYYTDTTLRRFAADDDRILAKATTSSGRIVGFMVGKKTADHGLHIQSIATDSEYRRKGVGTALLSHAQKEYKRMTLYVDTTNIPAVRCYENNGFVTTNTIDDYYHTLRKDAYSMLWSYKQPVFKHNLNVSK